MDCCQLPDELAIRAKLVDIVLDMQRRRGLVPQAMIEQSYREWYGCSMDKADSTFGEKPDPQVPKLIDRIKRLVSNPCACR